MRKCIKCGEEKPETNEYFSKQLRGKNGLRSVCKVCCREYCKKWHKENKEHEKRYREVNKEAKEKKYKQWHENHPGYYKQWCANNKEGLAEYRKKYNEANRERVTKNRKLYETKNKVILAEKRKARYEENKKEILEKCKLYRMANKEAKKARDRIYYDTHRDSLIEYQKKNAKDYPEKKNIINQRRRARKRATTSTLTDAEWEAAKEVFGNRCCYCGEEKPLTQDHFLALMELGEHSRLNIIPACRGCNCSKGAKDFFEWYPSFKHYSKTRERKILKFLNYKSKAQQLSISL